MRRVIWTDEAVENLTRIRAYIGQFKPLAAQRLAGRLLAATDSLVVQPDRGRPIGGGRRELVSLAPYLIRYVIKDEAVEITARLSLLEQADQVRGASADHDRAQAAALAVIL